MLFLLFFANAIVFLKLLKTFLGEGQAKLHMDRGQLLGLSFIGVPGRNSGCQVWWYMPYRLSHLRFVNSVHAYLQVSLGSKDMCCSCRGPKLGSQHPQWMACNHLLFQLLGISFVWPLCVYVHIQSKPSKNFSLVK